MHITSLDDSDSTMEDGEGRTGLELVTSVSDKHLDLLRPSARYCSMFKGQMTGATDREKGKCSLIRDEEDTQLGIYDKSLPCFGCGIGWFSYAIKLVITNMLFFPLFSLI
ncbi:hypothetical protein BUALT_Bualt09G0037000 [Buddleja alternifolia]|uniref:Uncharacterized protein n=1 Tax=Buddleja alternifolia TaxID=168488 RepID=A0AAV6X710_9LAMI|nr:hypothetical protein BUALT_Bualt09G0037000 [Buddleja alternifolia]